MTYIPAGGEGQVRWLWAGKNGGGGGLKAWVVTWVMGGAINNMQQNK